MNTSLAQRSDLTERADTAYQRARVLVYDRLPAGAAVDIRRLSSVQRDAIVDLMVAEANLVDYRRASIDKWLLTQYERPAAWCGAPAR